MKSFTDVLTGKMSALCQVPDVGSIGTHRGEPAVVVSQEKLSKLAEPFQNVLIGRFAFGRPSLEDIR